MTPENRQQLDTHIQAIAQLLYSDAQAEGLPMSSLADIEQTVRAQLQSRVSPGLGIFLSKPVAPTPMSRNGELSVFSVNCGSLPNRPSSFQFNLVSSIVRIWNAAAYGCVPKPLINRLKLISRHL